MDMRDEQRLQGVIMAVIGPTFFSSPVGDHPAGDGLTRLQTVFAGASSADISQYLIGSGTNDEMTVSDGSANAVFDSNLNPKSLVYSDVGISQISDDAPLTYEIFWVATLDTPSPQSPGDAIKFAQFTTHLNGIDFYIRGYPNDTDILIVQSGFTTVTVTAGHSYGTQNHLALVNRSTGVMDIYLNGVRVVTGRNDNTTLAGLGTMQLGGIGRGDTRVRYYGARVRRAEMYSDSATVTPPLNPAAWGPP